MGWVGERGGVEAGCHATTTANRQRTRPLNRGLDRVRAERSGREGGQDPADAPNRRARKGHNHNIRLPMKRLRGEKAAHIYACEMKPPIDSETAADDYTKLDRLTNSSNRFKARLTSQFPTTQI
jgi:hypothetical protein